MLSTLTVEKESFTENPVDCLYFLSFLGRSEYILVRYKDSKSPSGDFMKDYRVFGA